MKTYEPKDLPWLDNEATLMLRKGDRAWHPACTTCWIYGPATLLYRRFPDGGIDCRVEYDDEPVKR